MRYLPPFWTADEVRNFVADLAHLAYSRGVPAGPLPTPAAAEDPNLADPPSSSGHIMQQSDINLPAHMTPGHPSFDQHAYQLLIQQQQQQPMTGQLQGLPQHQQELQHASMQTAASDSVKDELQNQQAMQDPERQASEGQHA